VAKVGGLLRDVSGSGVMDWKLGDVKGVKADGSGNGDRGWQRCMRGKEFVIRGSFWL